LNINKQCCKFNYTDSGWQSKCWGWDSDARVHTSSASPARAVEPLVIKVQ